MFLRRHTKLVGDNDYTYWALVKSIRTAKGSRHQVVAHLGKLTPEETQQAREWSDLEALLNGTPPAQQLPLDAPPPPPPAPLWRTVDVSRGRVERVRQFGRVYLAPALWRTLEQWMASKGLGTCARQLLKELDELHSMDVVLPTDTKVELRLRVVAQPEKELAQLLVHLGLALPKRPKILPNVVPKIVPQKSQVPANQANHSID